jgi:hypothetical protein
MSLIQLKQAMRKLSLVQLKRLDDWLHELIRKAEQAARVEETPSRKQIVEERAVENRTYRLEGIRCGKENVSVLAANYMVRIGTTTHVLKTRLSLNTLARSSRVK